MGRPPSPNPADRKASTYLDAHVDAEVRRRAQAQGQTVAAWLRGLVFQAIRPTGSPEVDSDRRASA